MPVSPYSVHPGVVMVQNAMAGLKTKTGRTMEEWIALINKSGPPTESERVVWLKQEHGLGTNYAGWIAERSFGRGEDGDPETYLREAARYVEEMYSGPKAALRPIYEQLLNIGLAVAPDIKACPCQTIVPLYRNHVFAQIKPTTNTRIDMGFALRDTPVSGRLIDTGGFAKKDRITHRIPIASLEEIDEEVKTWMRVAYEMDA